MRAQGPTLIENIGNILLHTFKLRKIVSSHETNMYKASEKLMEKLALLQEVIDMKTNITMTHMTLKKGQEPFLHWNQSFDFIVEISVRSENELKDVHDLV